MVEVLVKYHLKNVLVEDVQSSDRFKELTEEEHIRLYDEIKNAVLQGIESKLLDMALYQSGLDNKVQSLLLWVLGITDEKPTSPQKIKSAGSYCDIDLDFSQEKREQVFKYLAEKYGADRFGHIATFGTMAAKGAIRNAARALGYPTELQNKLAKFIPNTPGITIQESIDASDDFQKTILGSKDAKHIIDVARKLEGLPNSLSTHASACIISDIAATDRNPMMASTKKDNSKITTQFDMKDVESNGLLKYDILGLKNLDIINETVKLIKKYQGVNIDIHNIDMNDPGIYELLGNGYTTAIFQFDGSAAAYLPRVKVGSINEISDMTSILRPGPMEMGMLDQYILAKFENKKYTYNLKDPRLIEKVWDICYRSYGLLVYQEQVIKCFTEIGRFDEIEGDNARRAMGKKLPEEMAKLKGKFIDGGVAYGYTKEDLSILFDQIEGFAGYGFNASHAVCYSVITCQTAYLSYYYPVEFFTAAMTVDAGNTDKIRSYIRAAKERDIKICPPDINNSDAHFIIKDGAIIFGLNAIKGVGASTSRKIMTKRPKAGYTSVGHFIHRNRDLINSKILEAYTKAGCFSQFINKESILGSIQDVLDWNSVLKDVETYTIFDLSKELDNGEYIDKCIIKKVDKEDAVTNEIDSIGIYITKHPLEDYVLDKSKCIDIVSIHKQFDEEGNQIAGYEDGDPIVTVGALSGIEIKKTKAKTNMAAFNLDSHTSSIECIMFSQAYSKYKDVLIEGQCVFVKGKIREENDKLSLMVNEISTDIDQYAGKIIRKKINSKVETKTYTLDEFLNTESFIEAVLGVQLNDRQKFMLRKLEK